MQAISEKIPPSFLAERQRQISVEEYHSSHDDEHVNGEMLAAARMYWQRAIGVALPTKEVVVQTRLPPIARLRSVRQVPVPYRVPVGWPWDATYWKPKTPQRDLERAGALCLAEIDRLKRRGDERAIATVEEQLGLIASAYRALPPIPTGAGS